MNLVFHFLAGAGSFAQHVKQLTGHQISDAALSQRRQALPFQVFESMLEAALEPKAHPADHPAAFYQGLRLCSIDGTLFSVANTPQIKGSANKAQARRARAAFAKVGLVVLVETGLHNPLAAAIGVAGESEAVLAHRILDQLPAGSLLLADRYYGSPKGLVAFRARHPEADHQFLVRVKANTKARVLATHPDGTALVEIQSEGERLQVREIRGRVRRGAGGWTEVRLWTSLLDWRRDDAATLLALYLQRWEQEVFYRELKIDMRSAELLQSHTLATAAQELAAMIIGYSLLVDERMKAAREGEVPVLRISFLKTLEAIRGLWRYLEVSEGLLKPGAVRVMVRRVLRQIADQALPKRRARSCPRQVRQPVSSWPRLLENTYNHGDCEYELASVLGPNP